MNSTSSPSYSLQYWERPWFKVLLFGVLGMIYLLNRSPHVGFDDGLSFLYEAERGFSPYTNATSHFLYNNVQHILLTVFGFLPSVLVLTLFSIACSLGALYRILQCGRLITGGMIVIVLPVIILGLSFTFWQQTEIIEVYAFNNFLFLSFFYFALKDFLREKSEHWWLVSLLLGLALLTHIQNILALPFFAWYLIRKNGPSLDKKMLSVLIVGLLFFVLMLPPLISPETTNSISAIFFDRQFGGDVTSFDPMMIGRGMLMGMGYLMYNFHIFLFFILHGWWLMWRNRSQLFWCLALIFVPWFGFAVKYSVNDNHVFFLIAYLVFVLPSIFSFIRFAERLMPRMSWMLPMLIMMGPMMYAGATMMGKKVPQLAEYHQKKAYKGGVTHLLWPGRAWAPDPLEVYQKLQAEGGNFESVEWNWPAAERLLHLRSGTEPEIQPFIYFQF